MSAEPKRVEELAAWFHREFHPCMHPNNSINQCEARADQFARTSGWVSPEEATAREAAARREALLEAARDIEAELVCCDVYERLSGRPSASWSPEEQQEYRHHSICYWGSASIGLVTHLAEPERDEEGGND